MMIRRRQRRNIEQLLLDARFSHLYFCQSLNRLERGLSAMAELLVKIRENALHWLMLEPGGAPKKRFWGYKWVAVDPRNEMIPWNRLYIYLPPKHVCGALSVKPRSTAL